MTSLAEHPHRARVLHELHARPFTPLAEDRRLLHFAFLVTPGAADADRSALDKAYPEIGEPKNCRFLLIDAGRIRWERHGEFITYTMAVDNQVPASWPLHIPPPGPLIVAVDLSFKQADEPVDRGQRTRMIETLIADGSALFSSDLLVNGAGFIEIEIVNRGMSADLAGATAQRILELETYRTLALLGLATAEDALHAIAAIEEQLPEVMARMDAAHSLEDNRQLLDRLSGMTLELERMSAASHFRLGATRAYSELVNRRLLTIKEAPSGNNPGLCAFFSRRFDPAIRTCTTATEREANLARKLTRAAQLLRTRVEIALESQNRDLLVAMGNRLRLQLRLQHTVEGLSVAAISYYIVSLIHTVLSGLANVVDFNPELTTSLSAPMVVLMITLTMLRVRRRHREDY